jgi:His/Glu/Gln/Arg/opine family amino acid ABC transporter permease subunit
MAGYCALRALRPVLVEVERERDHLAFAHQARGGDDVLGLGEVERADLVLGPQRPQFLNFSAASRRSWRVSLRAGEWVAWESGSPTGMKGNEAASVSGRGGRRRAHRRRLPGAQRLREPGGAAHRERLRFLEREAGFEISESPFLRYSASNTYLSALLVGIGNTLRVAAVGIVAATLLGAAVGLFRLSKNFLLRTLAAWYVEFIRNSPLLVQLFFWYAVITEALPMPREALQPLPGVFLTNRGIYFPAPGSVPVLESFNFAGGFVLTPEFTALLLGLTVYTAAFIAEIVRAGCSR